MRSEEGKRYLYQGKRYFILDGCARELEGASFTNLFNAATLVMKLPDAFMSANDWKIGFEIVEDAYVAKVAPDPSKNGTNSTYWLNTN